MARKLWRRTVFAALMISCGTFDGVVAQAQTGAAQGAQMTLRVRNDAQLPGDVLTDAKAAVADIYATAAIAVTFVNANADFTIVLLSRHTADDMRQIADAVGFAPGTQLGLGRIAYVLQPRVDVIAKGYTIPRAIVLAVAVAHEVGHLLMINAHSSTGLMRPTWNQADFRQAMSGNLLFTQAQAVEMRTRLSRSAPASE